MRAYLSGPIERAHDNELNWFDTAELALKEKGFEVFNPMKDGCDILIQKYGLGSDATGKPKDEIRTIANAEFLALRKDPKTLTKFRAIMNTLVDVDMQEIRKADIVMVHASPTISGGTAGEITLARHLNIPVVGFCPTDPCTVSGWVLACCDSLFVGPKAYKEALQEVIEHAKELSLVPGLAV